MAFVAVIDSIHVNLWTRNCDNFIVMTIFITIYSIYNMIILVNYISDEEALVDAAKMLGVVYESLHDDVITINTVSGRHLVRRSIPNFAHALNCFTMYLICILLYM